MRKFLILALFPAIFLSGCSKTPFSPKPRVESAIPSPNFRVELNPLVVVGTETREAAQISVPLSNASEIDPISGQPFRMMRDISLQITNTSDHPLTGIRVIIPNLPPFAYLPPTTDVTVVTHESDSEKTVLSIEEIQPNDTRVLIFKYYTFTAGKATLYINVQTDDGLVRSDPLEFVAE